MSNKWNLINADSGEKTWLTPKYIIDALGHFDTDPCCPPNMPWRTADTMLTKADDGTTAPWHGRVWLNPPYGREAWPFLERMAHHQGGYRIIALSNRHETMARARVLVRTFHPIHAWTYSLLSRRRHTRRNLYRTFGSRRILCDRHGSIAQQRNQGNNR